MNPGPQIVREEATGKCWQVAWWPDAPMTEDGRPTTDAVLKRGRWLQTVPVDGFFEKYTVVC